MNRAPLLIIAAVSALAFALAWSLTTRLLPEEDAMDHGAGRGDGAFGMTAAGDWYHGSLIAPVAVDAYVDYGCPRCVIAAQALASPEVIASYIASSEARVIYRLLPGQAPEAAAQVQCAAQQGLFWEAHTAMLAGAPLRPALAAADADLMAWERCTTSPETAAALAANAERASSAGVDLTALPAVYADGARVIWGADPAADILATLQDVCRR